MTMSRPLDELHNLLSAMIDEHRKLLAETERHQKAIRTMDVPGMDASCVRQADLRSRIGSLEARRRPLIEALVPGHRGPAITLTNLAERFPQSRTRMLAQRDELRDLIGQIKQRTHVAGRVATTVLRHLNSVVRMLSGAVQQAGVYTKQGVPKLSARIGSLDSVG
jgi:hypothetical protein